MAKRKPKLVGRKVIPTGAIRYMVGAKHVGVPLDEIQALFVARCLKAGTDKRTAKLCGRYAREVHIANRKNYLAVNRGVFVQDDAGNQRLRRAAISLGRR